MQHKTQKILLQILIVVSVLGTVISSYLLYNHHLPGTQNELCTSASIISCSVVNSSKYATLLDLPVALYGIIWFVFSGLLSYGALSNKNLISKIFWWNTFGFVFVIYLIVTEFLLKTICLLCTSIHVLVLAALIISTSLYISKARSSISEQ